MNAPDEEVVSAEEWAAIQAFANKADAEWYEQLHHVDQGRADFDDDEPAEYDAEAELWPLIGRVGFVSFLVIAFGYAWIQFLGWVAS